MTKIRTGDTNLVGRKFHKMNFFQRLIPWHIAFYFLCLLSLFFSLLDPGMMRFPTTEFSGQYQDVTQILYDEPNSKLLIGAQ